MTLAAIPSPTTAVWEIGPLPIRAYALFIVLGIVIACVLTELRLRRRGANPNTVLDIAVWAVPFGIIGARIYHVITSPQAYFGSGGEPIRALYIWEGGLGIWGAVAGGVFGAWLACRQLRLPFVVVLDAAAVGLPLAQAVGRLGNWFNNELYGRPTELPWGLRVWEMSGGRAQTDAAGDPVPVNFIDGVTYHPTFLYELLWNVGVAVLVWQVGKRLDLGRGRSFALYVAGYTAGRTWIELLRVDDANEILGLRVNVWVSVLVFAAAMIYLLRARGGQAFLIPIGDDQPGYRAVSAAEYAEHRAGGAEAVEAAPELAADGSGAPDPDAPAPGRRRRDQTASSSSLSEPRD